MKSVRFEVDLIPCFTFFVDYLICQSSIGLDLDSKTTTNILLEFFSPLNMKSWNEFLDDYDRKLEEMSLNVVRLLRHNTTMRL